MSAELDQAVYTLLNPARLIIQQHTRNEYQACAVCLKPWPCFDFDTAMAAFDLVLRVHAAAVKVPAGGDALDPGLL